MQLNKIKILRILFKLSFLPYILLLLFATYNSIFGVTVFSSYYGLSAFKTTIVFFGLLGCICFPPIFPIAFIYEIFYLIWIKVKKINTHKSNAIQGEK